MNSKAAAGIAVLVVLMMGAIAIGVDWEELGYDTSDPGVPNGRKVVVSGQLDLGLKLD
ncbi:MAG: hypothetical protein J6O90_00605 [Candidatus Methanomethylophilaceae archaeon]|nr:hypothetical protein [Candidatus Methanomethylophilaceae archaeon]